MEFAGFQKLVGRVCSSQVERRQSNKTNILLTENVFLMKYPYGGYAGRILRVDLSKRETKAIPLSDELVRDYIGGSGFCAKILWDETDIETDPLGPENRLVFAVGPLTGTGWPQSGRFNVGAKSPATGVWGEASAGGQWAPQLKYAGYDAIVVQGRAETPTYLWIDDDTVELRDARSFWGKDVWQTEDTIKKETGDEEVRVASIGQAGENLVRFAGIINSKYRAAARAGMGAVMGSKNLKAIAVRGSTDVSISSPAKFSDLIDDITDKIMNHHSTVSLRKYGTSQLNDIMNEIGRFPTKNFQTGVYPNIDKLSCHVLVEKYKIKDQACFACHFACKNYIIVRSGPYAGSYGSHPEYETVNSFGGRCWNDDLESILHLNWLCDRYGLDTISTGGSISFAMELWEKGIINQEDTEGLDFSWGNKETIIEMVHRIALRKGFGNILAEGVMRAAERIGKGAREYAMHVKGLEISAQDGRAQKSMAIAHATSVRGADHLRHCSFLDEVGNPEAIRGHFGEQYLPEMADRLATKYKGILAKGCEDYATLLNSLVLCNAGDTFWPPIIWWDKMAEVYEAVTGVKTLPTDLQKTADRIICLKRAYNIRLGLARKEDRLPKRFSEPAPAGPCKGHIVELEPMIDEYYTARGWDVETGLIPRSKLSAVGLEDVANQLGARDKLPRENKMTRAPH